MTQTYTLDQIAELMKKNKWHLIEIEEAVQSVEYGTVEVRLEVRAGAVEKVSFFNAKTQLRPKEGHLDTTPKAKLNTSIFGIE